MTSAPAQSTLGAAPSTPPTGGAPPGVPPKGPPFQSALEAEQARTATAEGQQQSHSQSASPTDSEGAGSTDTLHHTRHAPAKPAGRRSAGELVSATQGAAPGDTARRGEEVIATAAVDGTGTRALGEQGTGDASVFSQSASPSAAATDAASPAFTDNTAAASSHAESDTAAASLDIAGTALGSAPASDKRPPTGTDRFAAADRAGETAQGATTDVATAQSATAQGAKAQNATAKGATANVAKAQNPTAHNATASSGTTTAGDSAAITGSAGTEANSGTATASSAVALATDATSSSATYPGSTSSSEDRGSQTSAHQPVAHEALRLASGVGAHGKLWIPDSTQTSTGAGGVTQTSTGPSVGGVSASTEGAISAQASTATSGAPQIPLADLGPVNYGVGLEQAIENLHGTIQLAARQGLSQARIALQPEELGEIRIHLTQTAQGLLARVSAETPATAQALAAAHAELHKSLSSLGLHLTRLDIGRHDHSPTPSGDTAHQGDGCDGGHRGEASSNANRSGQPAAITGPANLTTDPSEEHTPPSPPLSRGALLDVLV